jgi:methyl-accepting chemotaxis protein
MKNMSISQKILLQVAMVTFAILVVAIFVMKYFQSELEEDISKETEKSLVLSIKDKMSERLNVGLSNAISIANDERIKFALKDRDRSLAADTLSKLESSFRQNYGMSIKVHIHTKNNHSFLRHWKPTKFGDDLSGFRATVVEVNRNKKSLKAIETGRAGLVIRGLAPISLAGEHLGSVEFIQGYADVAKSLKEDKLDFLVLMNKELVSVAKFADTSKSIKNYVLSLKNYNQSLFAEAKRMDFDELMEHGHTTTENYFIAVKKIKDYSGKSIGLYLIAENLETFEHTIDESTKIITSAIILLIALSVIILIATILMIKSIVLRPIEELRGSIVELSNSSNSSHRIDIISNDEIGKLGNTFNNYLDEIDNRAKTDQVVINEVAELVGKAKHGIYTYTIQSQASSPAVEELKDNINSMIIHTRDNLNSISDVLISYGNSDFTKRIENNDTGGIIGSLEMCATAIGVSVSELLSMIKIVSDQLHSETDELAVISEKLSTSSNEQAASLEQTSAAVEEITAAIKSTAEKAYEMDKIAHILKDSADKGNELSTKTANAMDEINDSTSAIHEAINIIDQIAFQTNILSLNAAVEAATAGESGKGFAVVAGEVRSLAGRSAEAAKDIKNLVDEASQKANEGKEISTMMRDGFNDLNEKIKQTSALVDSVSHASKEQMEGMEQINSAISQLDNATQDNANAAMEVSTKATEVNDISDRLIKTTQRATFKKKYIKRVCDVDLVFDTTKLKLDHIKFKNDSFAKLDSGTKFDVTSAQECALGKWMSNHSAKDFAQDSDWKAFEKKHIEVHELVQKYIDLSANNKFDTELTRVSVKIEEDIKAVFKHIDNVKEKVCAKGKANRANIDTTNNTRAPHKSIDSKPTTNSSHKDISNNENWETF